MNKVFYELPTTATITSSAMWTRRQTARDLRVGCLLVAAIVIQSLVELGSVRSELIVGQYAFYALTAAVYPLDDPSTFQQEREKCRL